MRKLVFTIVLFITLALDVNGQNVVVPKTTTQAGFKPNLDRTPAALGISASILAKTAALKNPPLNIALFGVDRRTKDSYGNADMIMIISIDQVSGKVKLSSILRDTYVNISGHGMGKINAAFADGGPQLAIKTINENLNLDIKDYISIDFFGSAKIIDALGGTTVNVKKEEISYLNNYLNEIAAIEMSEAMKITRSGIQRLNGKQTVAYTRIRATGNNDYERTERQRMVVSSLLESLRTANSETFPSLGVQVFPNLETSMSGMKLFALGTSIFNSKNKVIQPARFPLDTESRGITINGTWYLSADLKRTAVSLHNFIYKDIVPQDK